MQLKATSNRTQKSLLFSEFFIKVTDSFHNHCAFQYRYHGAWVSLSFKQFKQQVDTVVAYLESLALKPGDYVVIISESCIEWPVFLFAAWLRGLIVVPLDTKLTETQLLSIIETVNPSLWAVSPVCYKHFENIFAGFDKLLMLDMHNTHQEVTSLSNLPLSEVFHYHKSAAHAPVLIAFTSSTSGASKGVTLSWENLYHQVQALGGYLDVGPENVFLSLLPLNHMLELSCGLLSVFSKGAQICYLGSLLPDEILKASRTKNVSHMIAVPMFLDMLQNRMQYYETQGLDLKLTLHTLIIGGAQLNTKSIQYFAGHNIQLLQGYGLTEASPVVTLNMQPSTKPKSIGQALPQVSIQFSTLESQCKGGEILVKGPNVMLGYYNDSTLTQATLKNGWLHTGDLGYQDKDGFIYITGRLKNIIILPSGKNVSAEEVERCIQGCHHVKEVSVMGICLPHPFYKQEVEQICALVCVSEAVDLAETKAAIEQQCRQLNVYKRPQQLFFYDQSLPKTTTGKIQKQSVQAIAKKLYILQNKGNN